MSKLQPSPLADFFGLKSPFSPPAQKPVSELGGSGAGLAGNPDQAISASRSEKPVSTEKPKKATTSLAHLDSMTSLAFPDTGKTFASRLLPAAALPSPVVDICGSCLRPESIDYGHKVTSCVPVTMSGDAWESAAHHVLAIRNQKPVNADTWRQIGDFLQDLPSVRS